MKQFWIFLFFVFWWIIIFYFFNFIFNQFQINWFKEYPALIFGIVLIFALLIAVFFPKSKKQLKIIKLFFSLQVLVFIFVILLTLSFENFNIFKDYNNLTICTAFLIWFLFSLISAIVWTNQQIKEEINNKKKENYEKE